MIENEPQYVTYDYLSSAAFTTFDASVLAIHKIVLQRNKVLVFTA